MEKKTIDIGNEVLAYLDVGQGDVVLMIHGNMSSSIHYEPLISRIQDKYRCIAVDLRGFGDSSYNRRFDTLGELAEDVDLLLEKLEIPSVYLVGWSNGGGVALELCARHPEKIRKFFDIEGASLKGYPLYEKDAAFQPTGQPYPNKEALAADPVSVAPVARIFETRDAVMMEAIWDATIYTVNKPTMEQSELWIAETMKQRNIVDLDWALATLNMSEEYTPYGKGDGSIKKVSCPVALTMGEKDVVVPDYMVLDNYNALKPNAVLLPYENCGHSPMVDCPDRLAADICHFFA
ncbi:MAG: alpha/beta hydrolase [Oscillospiraceae bacterium]|nr:alpha/beta hydrolase [Oscillospiraceae bacterium]